MGRSIHRFSLMRDNLGLLTFGKQNKLTIANRTAGHVRHGSTEVIHTLLDAHLVQLERGTGHIPRIHKAICLLSLCGRR